MKITEQQVWSWAGCDCSALAPLCLSSSFCAVQINIKLDLQVCVNMSMSVCLCVLHLLCWLSKCAETGPVSVLRWDWFLYIHTMKSYTVIDTDFFFFLPFAHISFLAPFSQAFPFITYQNTNFPWQESHISHPGETKWGWLSPQLCKLINSTMLLCSSAMRTTEHTPGSDWCLSIKIRPPLAANQ